MPTNKTYSSVGKSFISLALALFSAFCLLASWVFLGPLQSNIEQNVSKSVEKYVHTLRLYGHNNLQSLVNVIEDHARLPHIVHSVMRTHVPMWKLQHQLLTMKLMGRDVNYTLLDYQGNPIASETDTSADFSGQTPWVRSILDGRRTTWIDAGYHDTQPFWRIAVPIRYNQYVEGVLVAECPVESLLDIIISDDVLHPHVGIELVRGTTVLEEKGVIPSDYTMFQSSLSHSGIQWNLLWDHDAIRKKMTMIYIRWLFFFCLTALVIVFFFYLYGSKKIVYPQEALNRINQQLFAQKKEIEGQYQQLKAAQLDLEKKNRELAAEKNQMEAIIHSVQDGIITTDAHGTIQTINPAARKLYGLAESKLLGKTLAINAGFSELKDALEKMILEKTAYRNLEFFLKNKKTDRQHYLRASLARVSTGAMAEKEEYLEFVVVLIDLTREKELEHMKTAFINTAAHELRTPLTSIQGFSELLVIRKTVPPEKIHFYAKKIHSQTKVLSAIVSRLEDVSTIESGRTISIFPTLRDLPDLIRKTIDLAGTSYGSERLEMQCQPCDPFYFDINRIRQVIWDLIANALIYSSTNARVRVEGWMDIARYFVVIRDEGMGIDTAFAARVFDGFLRADTSSRAPGGFGLSIYLAKHIIDAHHGQIFMESEPGRGTEFTICLPRN
ncbi:PAS domain S-box-containing protein [Desulfosalsimonas propionicica]|uniref:histidine kinase n=1 Tax=Desulfosalsimonas propionicica TaxID=332175 RepID=A0A7W0HKM8_9BACT|nr:ATP-binding protein [Desulfosalsimonas propionicica]MBA2881449.1 PAS domain S-box-containing protein [Desulfosalsimonas propionicica]